MGIKFRHRNWKFKAGIILIGLSLMFFALLAIIPFLDIEKSYKISFTSISFILAEVLFYSGGFLVGKEMFTKYKAYFNPKNWFKKNSSHKK